MASFPVSTEDLQQVANKACEQAIGSAEKYEAASVESWNQAIIHHILNTLIEKTKTGEEQQPVFKYVATSTIIQQPPTPTDGSVAGRRGMHSSVGAFWNNERDGTFTCKYEGATAKGIEIVISINWISI